MRKLSTSEQAGIFFYVSILFLIAAIYLLGAGDDNIQPLNLSLTESMINQTTSKLSTNITVSSPGTTNQSINVSQNESVMGNQTTSDAEVPFVGDLKALSITHKPEVLHRGEKGNFTFRFLWDGKKNSGNFIIGLYVDDTLVNKTPPGWMSVRSSDIYSLYWTANDTGEKNISIRLDISDEIAERNEDNNDITLNLMIISED